MADFGDVLGSIVKDGANYAKNEIVDLVNSAKQDAERFVQNLGAKLEQYVRELASGDLTQMEFGNLVKGLADLSAIKAAQIDAQAKVRAEKIADGIQNLVVDSLLKVLK